MSTQTFCTFCYVSHVSNKLKCFQNIIYETFFILQKKSLILWKYEYSCLEALCVRTRNGEISFLKTYFSLLYKVLANILLRQQGAMPCLQYVQYLTSAANSDTLSSVHLSSNLILLVSLLIFIALTNKVINKVTGALATYQYWKDSNCYLKLCMNISIQSLPPLYAEEYHPAQVQVNITVFSGLCWIG